MDEKKIKLVKLMRFWLFGTFIIVFAAVTTYAAAVGVGTYILKEAGYWATIGITAGLCILIDVIYEFWWLKRRPAGDEQAGGREGETSK